MSDIIKARGVITKVLPSTMFRVKLENGTEVLANISGKLRQNFIRLTQGDSVEIDIPVSNPKMGRITYRAKTR